MKYFVQTRNDAFSEHLTQKFHTLAASYGLLKDDAEPNIVVSIGGDGTLLHAFHRFIHRIEHVAFVGIHTGHLGFFADWKPDELESLVELIAKYADNPEQTWVQYPLIQIDIQSKSGNQSHLSLNEFTLKGTDATLVAQLNINDEMFEMFRGDGICISTPPGSTAYNKSAGGAILHPSLETIQIAEIASINNRVYRTLGSSMVLPKHHHCDIYPHPNQNILVTIDHVASQRNDLTSIRCQVAEQKVNFARYRPFPFWNRVRDAFIGYEIN